jgi:hypothetical protein
MTYTRVYGFASILSTNDKLPWGLKWDVSFHLRSISQCLTQEDSSKCWCNCAGWYHWSLFSQSFSDFIPGCNPSAGLRALTLIWLLGNMRLRVTQVASAVSATSKAYIMTQMHANVVVLKSLGHFFPHISFAVWPWAHVTSECCRAHL